MTIDLNRNANQNSSKYFSESKKIRKKLEGSMSHVKKCIKDGLMELKEDQKTSEIMGKVTKENEEESINPNEEIENIQHWFELFHWFISTENLWVLAPKTEAQKGFLINKVLADFDLVVMAKDKWAIVKNAWNIGSLNEKDEEKISDILFYDS